VEEVLDARGRERFEASGAPGIAAFVRFADGRAVGRAFGTAGAGAPMRTDTVFQALSFGKPVTAACALSLAADGVLHVDEPVARWLPAAGLPERLDGRPLGAVTLRQLLSHKSGLAALLYGHANPAGPRPAARDVFLSEHDEGRRPRLVRDPGAAFEYTGAGFALAEVVLETATGRPFADLARERVLAPLGMWSSGFDPDPALLARLATPHDREGVAFEAVPWAAIAAANFHSTAEDATSFAVSLMRGDRGEPAGRGVVPPDACDRMLAPHVVDAPGAGWGLGFRLKWDRFERRFVHLGYDAGWYGHLEGLRRRRVAFALLTNGDRGRDAVAALARDVRRVLYDVAF
jgi:CubicO group peptidase (beta-lactamase class C family)